MKYYATTRLSENIHETPEGFLICLNVPIARTGEMVYMTDETPLKGKDGKVVIYRDEEEVFRPETIASFQGKPVTIRHPKEFVTKDNWRHLSHGSMQNVRRGEGEFKDDLMADVLITDRDAINMVKSGLREVSCGYEADYVQLEDGKGKQINIIGNHLALVEKGRAGSAYAIFDHKGETTMKKKKQSLIDKVSALFAKAQDDAMKVIDAEVDVEETVDEDKDKPAKKDEPAKDEKSFDADAVMKAIDELKGMLGAKKEEPAKDVEGEAPPSLEDRLAKLEAAVSKLLEGKAEDEEVDVEDEEVDVEDEDKEKEEAKDKAGALVGDEVSRAEILAPGIDTTMKDVKRKSLIAAYATKEGKQVIHALTGDKAPDFKSKDKVDTLFVAASELLKQQRSSELVETKKVAAKDRSPGLFTSPKSSDDINEINRKHYNRH